MRKELLTRDMIKKDIKEQYISGLIFITIHGLFFTLLSAILIFNCAKNHYFNLSNLLFIIPLSIIAIICWFGLIISIINIIKIKNDRYEIVSDKLKRIETKIGTSLYTSPLNRPNRFYFKNYGSYSLPYGKNHKFSKSFCMDDDRVVYYATEGDIFYLVILNNTITAAYNSRLFELEQ